MKAARDANDREEMLSAIRVNWRLWTIIQAELLDPQCSVPMDVRTNVLSLAQFIDKHSVEIIGRPSPQQLDVLISINRELAGGLFTMPRPPSQETDNADPVRNDGYRRARVEEIDQTPSGFPEGAPTASSVRIAT